MTDTPEKKSPTPAEMVAEVVAEFHRQDRQARVDLFRKLDATGLLPFDWAVDREGTVIVGDKRETDDQ